MASMAGALSCAANPAVAYGNSRLSALSGAGAVEHLQDGRGSTVQEATERGGVTAWRAYTAQGALAAGSDTSGRPFFGYNSERQDARTGLVDMRARRYDASSGRFGVADAVLGALSEPLSLNRYLYCESDPVNFADPTGHARLRMDRSAKKGAASMDPAERLFTQVEFGMRLKGTGAMANAWGGVHTKIWEIKRSVEIRQQYGKKGQRLFERRAAESYRRHVQRIYCGSADHLKDFSGDMHALARALDGSVIGGVPVVPDLIDWCAYVAEGNVEMTVLYGIISLIGVVPYFWVVAPGASAGKAAAKEGSKIFAGGGVREVVEKISKMIASSGSQSTKKAASTLPGMGGKVTNILIRGNVKITFKHGDRHAIEMGLDPAVIESAIADDIQRIGVQGIREMGNGAGVDLVVDGTKLKYKPYVIDDNNVNVGTYIFE